MKRSIAIAALALAASSSAAASDATYFPKLATAAHRGDLEGLNQILALAETTKPGERLEELAELAASYVQRHPAVFVRAQASRASCFGVSFMGPRFVDRPEARAQEIAARRAALQSVAAQELAFAKERCLAKLAGS